MWCSAETRMPALLVEAGFLNTDQDNQLFDAKKEEMARGIANAILGTLDLETIESGENAHARSARTRR